MSDGSRKGASKSTFHFLAGLSSGLLSAVLLQPIDLLKTRVQQSGHHSLTTALSEIRRQAHLSPSRHGPLTSSITALWRGTLPSALRTGLGSAVYFTTLNQIRSVSTSIPFLSSPSLTTSSNLPTLSNTGNLLSGAAARTLAGFLLMPLTVLKVRYESSLYTYPSLPSAFRSVLATSGPRGFFAGFGATALRDAPYAGLYVLFYEQAKHRLSQSLWFLPEGTQEKKMGVSRAAAVNFSSALAAGTVCSVVSNPFDAVKTRIQLQPERYGNMVSAARKMLAEEGVRSMWDGLGLRMSRKAMSSALAWTVYEELIRRAEGWRDGRKERI